MKNMPRYLKNWKRPVVVGVMLAVWAGSFAIAQTASNRDANTPLLVNTDQVADHLSDSTWRIVDVRPAEQYAAGHIPGAVNLPVALLTQIRNSVPGMLAPLKKVAQVLGEAGIARETRVVIYDDFGSYKATRLFWVLDYLGHPRASVMQGGFNIWQQEAREISQGTPQIEATTYQAIPDASKLATRDWIGSHFRDTGILLLDARSGPEFVGQIPGRQVERPGHIPGAVNLDWVRNLTPEPRRFKAGTDLRRLYEGVGVTPEKEIVVYCRTGMRASHTYFVLRLLGYPRVRLYDGSYVEWAADTSVPVVL